MTIFLVSHKMVHPYGMLKNNALLFHRTKIPTGLF